MPFINPYNFVRPTRKPMPHLQGTTWERWQGRSGILTCRLTNETPLLVPSGKSAGAVKEFFSVGNQLAIPGTSLKGAFRCVAEAISGACSPFGMGTTDQGFGHCDNPNQLCPCCRLFGFMHKNTVLRGRVCITDALLEDPNARPTTPTVFLERIGGPKATHTAFYRDADNKPRGRKFYWHSPEILTDKDIRRTRRAAIDGGATLRPLVGPTPFVFHVRYNGLSNDELGLLLWTLFPGEDKRHKLGHGKGVGLGTIRVEPLAWEDQSAEQRYDSFDAPASSVPVADLLATVKCGFVRARANQLGVPDAADLFLLNDDALLDLGTILTPKTFALPVQYPSYEWFKDPTCSQVKLPTIADTLKGIGLRDRI